jgi:hypothetical protein
VEVINCDAEKDFSAAGRAVGVGEIERGVGDDERVRKSLNGEEARGGGEAARGGGEAERSNGVLSMEFLR